MAQPRKRDSSAPRTPPAETGRRAIHGDNPDYGDRVARRAYEIYLTRGSADGGDFDDWLTAERELTTGRAPEGDPRE
jgi:hypothetical protein